MKTNKFLKKYFYKLITYIKVLFSNFLYRKKEREKKKKLYKYEAWGIHKVVYAHPGIYTEGQLHRGEELLG